MTCSVAHDMLAVVCESYGPPTNLRVSQVPRVLPEVDEVLVHVHAAGVDRSAWHLATGRPYLVRVASGLQRPRQHVVGTELAGTVTAVGGAVTQFAPGDEVYGFGRGAFAEYCVARRDKLAPMPRNLSYEQAAAVPVSGTTAWQALVDHSAVQAGQKVLVIGASGGVGTFAVQIAKAFGAEVTGVASTAKLDLVRTLGADHVIDYTHEDFAAGGAAYDLIVDLAGNPSVARLRRALTPRGTAVIAGGEEGGSWTGGLHRQLGAITASPFIGQKLTTVAGLQRWQDLAQLTELIEAGSVVPRIDTAYPLTEAAEALAMLEGGHARGTYVLSI